MKKEYLNGRIVAYHGDCLDILPTLEKVDLVLTDPPYNGVNRKSNGLRNLNKGKADIGEFDILLLTEMLVDSSKGSGYIFCGIGQISYIKEVFDKKNVSSRLGFWEKTNPSPMNCEHLFMSATEPIMYFKKPNAVFNTRYRKCIFKYPSGNSNIHPTQKPIELFVEIMRISSKENDLVLDCFGGSGTTAIACIKENRRCIIIEKDKEYFDIMCKRIEEAIKEKESQLF